MERNFKGILGVCFFLVALFFPTWASAQNFNKSKYEKEYYYQVGLGVGDFFPSEISDDINSLILPTLSLGFGKRLGGHFGLKSTASIQAFVVEKPTLPFKGLSYALDLMPTVNLLPSRNQFDQPRINAELGMGIGYLIKYGIKEIDSRDFSYLEFSPYIPIRLALNIRFKSVNNLGVEGVFFNTLISPAKEEFYEINQFGQINLVMRRFLF
jgi:hypothetical protein